MHRIGWCGVWAALACTGAGAQVRPDAGTLLEAPRAVPVLPAPGGPRLATPAPAAPQAEPGGPVLTPAGFRFTGNVSVSSRTLESLLAPRVGQPTDLAGLEAATRQVRQYYQSLGLVLTDAYLPEQALPPQGAIVTIAIVEAVVGRVEVQAQGPAAARAHAEAVVAAALRPGAAASEDALDRPVLLLRDLPGVDATATVQPGARAGEVDVRIDVRATPPAGTVSVGADNHGVRAAGTARTFAQVDATGLARTGDQLTARLQLATQITDTRLYRVAYALPVGVAGTRLSLSLQRSEYALGGAFEVLGARGHADIAGASLLHPLQRTRLHNLYALAALEGKRLSDETALAPAVQRRIGSLRLGLLGNHAQEGATAAGFTSWALSATAGRLRSDALSAAFDQLPGGARAEGRFRKANLEAQHTQFLDGGWSLQLAGQLQHASRNLASAEKMSLGGPTGVRAYPAGDTSGDSGALVSLELRRQLPSALALAGEPVSAGLFYDAGRVRLLQDGGIADNHRSLRGAGLSFNAGRAGRYQASLALAWRVGDAAPAGGEPDRRPRVWIATQFWF